MRGCIGAYGSCGLYGSAGLSYRLADLYLLGCTYGLAGLYVDLSYHSFMDLQGCHVDMWGCIYVIRIYTVELSYRLCESGGCTYRPVWA